MGHYCGYHLSQGVEATYQVFPEDIISVLPEPVNVAKTCAGKQVNGRSCVRPAKWSTVVQEGGKR